METHCRRLKGNTLTALLEEGSSQKNDNNVENPSLTGTRVIISVVKRLWCSCMQKSQLTYWPLAQTRLNMIIITTIKQKQQYSRLFVQKRKSLLGHLEPLRESPLEPLHGLLGGEAELKARARSGVDVQVHRGRARLWVHSRACDACRTESSQSVSLSFSTGWKHCVSVFLFSPDINQTAIYSQKGVGTRTEKWLIPMWGPREAIPEL